MTLKKIIIFTILGFFSSCSKNKNEANDGSVIGSVAGSAIHSSVQRLDTLAKKSTIDTLVFGEALRSAYVIAQNTPSKHHDSLIIVVSQLVGTQLVTLKKCPNARFYYTNGLQFWSRHVRNDDFLIAKMYRLIGLSYRGQENFKVALLYYDSVKATAEDTATRVLKTQNLICIAECYHLLKNTESAQLFYNQLIPSVKSYFSDKQKIDFYNRYSLFLKDINQYQAAVNAANESVKILDASMKNAAISKPDSALLANSYYFIAYAFAYAKNYTLAETYYLKALVIYKRINNRENYGRILMNMGLMYRYDKRFDKAEQVLKEGIDLANKEEETDFNIVRKGKLFNNLSEVYLDIKQYKKALATQDSAIFYLTIYDKRASLTTLLLSNQKSLLSTYENKAKIYAHYAQNGQDTEGYQKALKCIEKRIELTDDIRADYFSDDAKLTLANDIKPALEAAIKMCQKLYQKTNDKRYLEKAFGFVEYSRGMVLYENTRLDNHLPPDLKAESEALKQREGVLIAKNDVEKLQEYLRLKRQFRERIKALNRNLMASVGDLQKALIPNNQTALIEYFVGDSSIFVFSLLQNDLIINELPKFKNFEKQIEALRREITQPKVVHDAANFNAQSYALYCYLLKQTLDTLPKNLTQLIIVPDGVLNYLPFDVLISDVGFGVSDVGNAKPSKDAKVLNNQKASKDASLITHNSSLKKSFQKSQFLLMDYTISYAYSANLLLEQKGMKKDAREVFGGFASTYAYKDTSFSRSSNTRTTPTRTGAYELKGTKEEVNQISDLLGGKAFVDAFSTEGVFKNEANRFKILHFAMHSLTDDKDASLSRLLFTLTPQDTTNDNDLTAAELQTMHLNADLAVLSACNTGFGTLNKGEGVMSLARAFFYAGVPSTVTSLWEVPDLKTRDIMIDFYKNLKKGMTKDEALRQAKLTYLDNTTESGTANPYFWAGFVPIGNMDSMDLSEKRPLSIWGILAGFITFFGLGSWFWKRKRA